MLVALIRPAEKHTATVQGTDLPALRAELVAQAPAGWELVASPVTMKPGGIRIVEGKFQRHDGVREIEADDMAALVAKIPDGWQMLSVRKA